MADEHSALLTIPRASPAEGDYDAICQAMMGTARGRWFLEQYASRNRNADTGPVLDAIARIEGMVRDEHAHAARQELRIELLEMGRTIAQTRADLAETAPPPAPAGANGAASNALAAAERLQDVAWTMRERGFDMWVCDQIADISAAIQRASALRDPNDGRSRKLGEVLRYLEQRIAAMLAATQSEPNGAAEEPRALLPPPAAVEAGDLPSPAEAAPADEDAPEPVAADWRGPHAPP